MAGAHLCKPVVVDAQVPLAPCPELRPLLQQPHHAPQIGLLELRLDLHLWNQRGQGGGAAVATASGGLGRDLLWRRGVDATGVAQQQRRPQRGRAMSGLCCAAWPFRLPHCLAAPCNMRAPGQRIPSGLEFVGPYKLDAAEAVTRRRFTYAPCRAAACDPAHPGPHTTRNSKRIDIVCMQAVARLQPLPAAFAAVPAAANAP